MHTARRCRCPPGAISVRPRRAASASSGRPRPSARSTSGRCAAPASARNCTVRRATPTPPPSRCATRASAPSTRSTAPAPTIEVIALKFVDRQEALSDVTSICRQLERELITAAYGPGLVGSSADYVVGEASPARAACLDAGAARATELLRFAAREAARALRPQSPVSRWPRRRSSPSWRAAKSARPGAPRQRRGAHVGDLRRRRVRRTLRPHSIDQFVADVGSRADCLVGGVYVQDALRCPAPVCGNGMEEAGEECDDGNADDTDACRADCVRTDCPVYATTFDLLQDAIFDSHGCSDDACHGDANAGGLDLRIGVAYDNLVGVPSMSSDLARVAPGDAEHSRLWLLLAKATLGRDDVPGRPMPIDPPALSAGRARGSCACGSTPTRGAPAPSPAPAHSCTRACPRRSTTPSPPAYVGGDDPDRPARPLPARRTSAARHAAAPAPPPRRSTRSSPVSIARIPTPSWRSTSPRRSSC